MTTTDPTITIAGLRARINSLLSAVQHSNRTTAERVTMFVEASSNADRLTAERDALAAQLAEVRAELAAAPKVCAIHSYALEGPCMTCGAPWPGAEKALRQERIEGMEKMRRISRAVGCPNSVEEVVEAVAALKSNLASERAHLATCRTRIAGLEQAADERSAEVARLTARVAELEARPVFAGVSEGDLCVQMLMAADPSIDPGIALVMVNGVHRAKVRAVLARLEVSLVAPVDPEQMARDFAAGVPVRATLIARGIPVTPEVGK